MYTGMKNSRVFDPLLYLVTDEDVAGGRSLLEIIGQAINGGVTMIQLREKTRSSRGFYQFAMEVMKRYGNTGVPIIINDRLDIAQAVDAHGVHVGQSDMPAEIAREILGPKKIIGLSVETIEQARDANNLDVDYIGISPVFHTPTKKDIKTPLGLDGIQEITSFSRHQIVGIGGINERNAIEVMKAGANGIAVVSAIIGQEDPTLASESLLKILKEEK